VTRYFVTGTDTGVGKTFVTTALARRARVLGRRVFAFKPIESGCSGGLGEDQKALCEAAGGWQSGRLAGVYQLAKPAAPRVAAQNEGATIDLGRIDEALLEGSEGADLVLVEGAGGWRVPVTDETDMADLARRVGGAVIVVARAGLGTINHSLLSVEAVERDGCQVAGLVLSLLPDEDRAFAESNVHEISRRWGGPVVLFDGDESALDCFM